MQTSSPALSADNERLNWPSSIPFFAVHLMCLAVFWVGAKPVDVAVCVGLYVVRMWGITVGYHRYFSHRAFKTGRVFQFILALVGSTSIQKGVLWWAANHRHHHRFSDQPEDLHSPIQRGFWWSHVSWILCDKYEDTRMEAIKDFARYPELVWLNRLHLVPPVLLAVALYFIGGFSMLVWGFFVSTTLLWHGTFTINSLSHIFGKRRYKTTDTSRNNWLLALITLGEGWHNNHHYHQNTANQGWFWWEVDFSYYSLKVLSWVGVVEGLRKPSEATKYAFRKYTADERAALAAPVSFWGAEGARGQLVAARTAAKAAAGDAAKAAGDAAKVAGDKVREALAAAADHLPGSAPSPQGLLKRQ